MQTTLPPAAELEPDVELQWSTVKDRWMGAVSPGSGFVAVPMSLLRLQPRYKLTPTEMLVLINIMAHWWEPNQVVYPRSTTIANRMGVDKRTVQRATQKLINDELVRRVTLPDGKRGFDFTPLARRLTRDMPSAYEVQGRETHGDF